MHPKWGFHTFGGQSYCRQAPKRKFFQFLHLFRQFKIKSSEVEKNLCEIGLNRIFGFFVNFTWNCNDLLIKNIDVCFYTVLIWIDLNFIAKISWNFVKLPSGNIFLHFQPVHNIFHIVVEFLKFSGILNLMSLFHVFDHCKKETKKSFFFREIDFRKILKFVPVKYSFCPFGHLTLVTSCMDILGLLEAVSVVTLLSLSLLKDISVTLVPWLSPKSSSSKSIPMA